MNIGWIHDFRCDEYAGGAELTNRRIVEHAPEWAIVNYCTPERVVKADRYIVNNVRRFSWPQWKWMMGQEYIIFCHDTADGTYAWQQGKVRELYKRAEAVIFLSPRHRDLWMERWNVDLDRTYLCPSAIDPSPFYVGEDKQGSFYAGQFRSFKGIQEIAAWADANEQIVDFYGEGPDPPQGEYVNVKGRVPYEQMPDIIASYERLVFLPQWIEAFGRVVAEAALSGCELIVNDRVGAVSWGWQTPDEWAAGVSTAHERFWSIIDEVWR